MRKAYRTVAAKKGFVAKSAANIFQALITVCGLFLMIALLYHSIARFALNSNQYPVGQDEKHQVFAMMAEELTQYLSGRRPSLSSLFTEREAAHMVDVLHLFQLGRRVSIFAATLFLIVVFAAWKTKAPRYQCLKRFQLGMGLFFLFAFLLALWAAIDFNGWFIVMHKVAFSNDLWLLDPRESMLIQMLPVEFFMRAVRIILARFFAYAAILTMLTTIMRILFKKKAR